ncbi:VOC family protein [Sphingomonas sp. 37zxx]|uniref:VOC family protein n=1 Tax=Sphingomonas sp. 37zxx TaxID=1550073 RepID=UPI00053BFF59|nr:VOC family protein [Sphingomonas sp. 37zxx]
MFSHITVGVCDLDRAGVFYDSLLLPLGFARRPVTADGGPPSLSWHVPGAGLPYFYAYLPFDGRPASPSNGGMVAFLAPSAQAVEMAYAAAIEHGGVDAGAPGPRPQYAPGYFGAYLRDPDGNKVHVVFRPDAV